MVTIEEDAGTVFDGVEVAYGARRGERREGQR